MKWVDRDPIDIRKLVLSPRINSEDLFFELTSDQQRILSIHMVRIHIATTRICLSIRTVTYFYISILQRKRKGVFKNIWAFNHSDVLVDPVSFGPYVLGHADTHDPADREELDLMLACNGT